LQWLLDLLAVIRCLIGRLRRRLNDVIGRRRRDRIVGLLSRSRCMIGFRLNAFADVAGGVALCDFLAVNFCSALVSPASRRS